jgi:Tfp pilus assembly protein FimT
MSKKTIKRPFTLLEIMLCITVLTIISGMIGFKIKEAVERQQFLSQISDLSAEIRRLQGFALSYGSTFGIRIHQREGKFCYSLISDEPLDFITKTKSFSLNGVNSMIVNKKELKEFSFDVLPSGKIEPPVELRLQLKEEKRVLDLGDPLHIKFVER